LAANAPLDAMDTRAQCNHWALHRKTELPIHLTKPKNDIYPLFYEVPSIGVYNGAKYRFGKRILSVRMDPAMMRLAPETVQKTVGYVPMPAEAEAGEEAVAVPASPPIILFFVIEGVENLETGTFNILFHGLLAYFYSPDADNFAENILMGLFDLRGIRVIDLAEETLTPLNVNCHGDGACSPNNAKFKVIRPISTFWTVGTHEGKVSGEGEGIEMSVVTYHLLINNPVLEEDIKRRIAELSPPGLEGDQPEIFNELMYHRLLPAAIAEFDIANDEDVPDEGDRNLMQKWIDLLYAMHHLVDPKPSD